MGLPLQSVGNDGGAGIQLNLTLERPRRPENTPFNGRLNIGCGRRQPDRDRHRTATGLKQQVAIMEA
jgi:hypothetical protein